jgi:hypothetical protein
MSSLVDLKRATYLEISGTTKNPRLNYLSSKYKNIRHLLPAVNTYVVTSADMANLPGIAYNVYRDKDYWWVIGLYNGIIFPERDLTPGLILQLPSLSDINALLASGDQTLTNVTI